MRLKFPIILSGNSFFPYRLFSKLFLQFPIILKIILIVQPLLTMFMIASHNKINIVLKNCTDMISHT